MKNKEEVFELLCFALGKAKRYEDELGIWDPDLSPTIDYVLDLIEKEEDEGTQSERTESEEKP